MISKHWAYYNERDDFAAAYLDNLITAGLIAPGVVDTRSIVDVAPEDLKGFTQCHFFAGIGIWSLALRLAKWPDDVPVWTGSCPCQPFSLGGLRKGFSDERHLYPVWSRLIENHEPVAVFGEQVSSKDGLEWLAVVQDDMEAKGYRFGALDLCSPSVGSENPRQRSYFVGLGDADDPRLEGLGRRSELGECREEKQIDRTGHAYFGQRDSSVEGWGDGTYWVQNTQGVWRRTEPELSPVAYGDSARVGSMQTFGNAINARVASEFISSVVEEIVEGDFFGGL